MTIDQDFEAFHAAHPEVYAKLRSMAFSMKRRGRRKAGIAMLFEVLRWEHFIRADSPADFKLNNNFRALYARKLMAEERELAGFFETRTLRSDQAPVGFDDWGEW